MHALKVTSIDCCDPEHCSHTPCWYTGPPLPLISCERWISPITTGSAQRLAQDILCYTGAQSGAVKIPFNVICNLCPPSLSFSLKDTHLLHTRSALNPAQLLPPWGQSYALTGSTWGALNMQSTQGACLVDRAVDGIVCEESLRETVDTTRGTLLVKGWLQGVYTQKCFQICRK